MRGSNQKHCVIALFGFLVACSSVDVHRIPVRSQYLGLSIAEQNKLQATADSIEGIRYYLPRPYIVVNKEFPVNSQTTLVRGKLLAGGRYASIVLTDKSDEPGREDALTAEPMIVPVSMRSTVAPVNDISAEAKSNNSETSAGNQAAIAQLSEFSDPSFFTFPTTRDVIVSDAREPVNLSFELVKTDKFGDTSLETVRKISLIPSSGNPIDLPLEFYNPTSGAYLYKDYLHGLSKNDYSLAVTFLDPVGETNYVERVVTSMPSDPALSIFATSSATDADRGSDDLAAITGPNNWDKVLLIMTDRSVRKNRGPLEFKLTLQDDYGVSGTAFVEPSVSKISIWSINDQGEPASLAYTLPSGIWKNNVYDFRGLSGVEPGNYQLVVHVENGSENQRVTSLISNPDARFVVTSETPTSLPIPKRQPINISQAPVIPDTPANPGVKALGSQQSQPGPGSAGNPSSPTIPKEQTTVGDAGSLTLVAGGDGKDSIVKLSDFLSITFLQDFEEQYAIQPKARLSKASANLSLENGWMLEGFNTDIDNRAIANFIFGQLDKTLDIVRNVVALEKGLIAGAASVPASPLVADDSGRDPGDLTAESRIIEREAIFRVHKIEYAVPGLYRIFKPDEIRARGFRKNNWASYEFDTREEIIVEAVTPFSETKPSKIIVEDESATKEVLQTKVDEIISANAGTAELGLLITVQNVDSTNETFSVNIRKSDGSTLTEGEASLARNALENDTFAGGYSPIFDDIESI